jgi:hypothetical protein
MLLPVADMDALSEFVFLEDNVLRGLVMEKTEGDYRVHDVYSKRPKKGNFNNIFSKRKEGKKQVFRVFCLQNANSHTPSHTV